MPTAEPTGPDTGPRGAAHPQLLARIGNQVLRALGEPAGLRAVHVKPLWADRYRANVVVGRDPATATVAHSYFLVATPDGTIVVATPTITRVYGSGPVPGPPRGAHN